MAYFRQQDQNQIRAQGQGEGQMPGLGLSQALGMGPSAGPQGGSPGQPNVAAQQGPGNATTGSGFINPQTYQAANAGQQTQNMVGGVQRAYDAATTNPQTAGQVTTRSPNQGLLQNQSGLATLLNQQYGAGSGTGQQYGQGQQNLDAFLTGSAGGNQLASYQGKLANALNMTKGPANPGIPQGTGATPTAVRNFLNNAEDTGMSHGQLNRLRRQQ